MIRRTTVAADSEDLAVLASEARRRGVSVAQVLREVVAEGAERRRASRPKPHLGIGSSRHPDLTGLSVEDEESPARGRLES